MAMETLKDFVEKAKSDEDLQKKLLELSEKKDTEAIQTLMKEHGVSEDDLQKLQDQSEVMREGGELSDEMLEAVAGGGCWSDIIKGKGVVCVAAYADDDQGCFVVYMTEL